MNYILENASSLFANRKTFLVAVSIIFVGVVWYIFSSFGHTHLLFLFLGFCYDSCTNGNCYSTSCGSGPCGTKYDQSHYYSQSTYYTQSTYVAGYTQSAYYTQGSYSSTPFLYIQKNDGSFHLENDVMFGKPSSYFKNINYGIAAFKAGGIRGDLYKIQTPLVIDDKTLRLQIREIEPEVSALFGVQLYRLAKETSKRYVTSSDFSGIVTFTEASFTKKFDPERYISNKTELQDKVSVISEEKTSAELKKKHSVSLESGDYIEFTVPLKKSVDKEIKQYILLESWYRDWTLGDVYAKSGILGTIDLTSPFSSFALAKKIGTYSALVMAGFLGFNINAPTNQVELLTQNFGLVPNVYADAPYTQGSYSRYTQGSYRSLEVSYKTKNGYKMLDIVEPRYATPDMVAILLPTSDEATAEITVRITATKRHNISRIGVASGTYTAKQQLEEVVLTSAYHERERIEYVTTLNSADNTNPVRTYPSDVLHLSYSIPSTVSEGITYEYFFAPTGVYAPATKEDQEKVGDWTKKLDSQAKKFLKTIYKDVQRLV